MVRFICLFLAIFILSLISNTPVNAQVESFLTLDNIDREYPISHHSYITTDDDQLLSPDTLISRHRNNLKGKRIDADVIHFKATPHSTWIVFSVYNKTPQDNWILDFGSALDGRMGLIKTINIMNYGTKQTLIYPKDENDRSSPFLGSAIPIRLNPGTNSTFVMYIEADSGFPLIISPTLKSQETYMAELVNGDVSNVLISGLFIFMMGFFAASYYIGRNKSSIALFSYYVLLCTLYFNLNVHLVSSFPISGSSLLFTFVASFTMLLVATKFFSKIDHDFKPIENMALVVLFIMVFAISALGNFVFGHSPLGISTICGVMFLCSFLTCIIAFFSSDKSIVVKGMFCGGILLSGLSAIILLLPIVSILPANSLSTHLFWICLFLQSILFIAAYLRSNVERQSRHQQELLKQEHEDQSLIRLQKSKDSADHARLLRVIERERELMAELREREVKRTEEMRSAKEIADEANKAKSAFLAVVSHEIRTPMNGILGMVQLMQQTDLSSKQNEYMKTIKNSGDTMMALLNDILDFEKIERGGMELENVNFDLHGLANDVVTLMSGHAAQKNIALTTDIHPDVPQFVSGDPTRLRQVLLNLVNNGLKFTSEGHVTISISTNEDNTLHFAISDSGIGISEEAQQKLFTPFTQAETSTTRKYGGTGLGLAISLRLIEAMGGKIEVKSKEGVGSTFFFNIDMPSQTHSDTKADGSSSHASHNKTTRPMKILVVEDNEMNRKVLDGLLTNKGHEILMAANGLEAIEACKKHAENIDIILMDIQMAGMDGVEATKVLRSDPNPVINRKPIIALTGNVILKEVQHYFEVGINGFVAKPVNADTLYEVLENAARGKFESPLPEIEEKEDVKEGINVTVQNTELHIDDSASVIGQQDATPPQQKFAMEEPKFEEGFDHEKTPVEPQHQTTAPAAPSIMNQDKPTLQFDNRDHFVDDSAIKKTDGNQDPFFNQNVGLSLEDSDTPIQKPDPSKKMQEQQSPKAKQEFKSAKPPEEMTEIQRYLMEQHSNQKKPVEQAKPKVDLTTIEMSSDNVPTVLSQKEDTPITPNQDKSFSREPNEVETHKPTDQAIEETPPIFNQNPEVKKPEVGIEVSAPQEKQVSGNTPTEAVSEPDSSTERTEPAEQQKESEESAQVTVEDFLDNDMLQSLLTSLGPDQFYNLLDGFVGKTEEIIQQAIDAVNAQDINALAARAHELKGMAGNFGLKHVSALSGDIEKMAKTGQKDQAYETTPKLNAAYANTQAALKQWRESQNSN